MLIIDEVQSGVIAANLIACAAKFPTAGVTWAWELVADTSIRYRMDVDDADSKLRVVLDIPWASGPVHDYALTSFYFESEETVSASSTRVSQTPIPSPDVATVATMTSISAVLTYLADFVDLLAHV